MSRHHLPAPLFTAACASFALCAALQIFPTAARAAALDPLPEDGPSSPLHTEKVGKIVFTSDENAIQKGKEIPAKFKDTFKISEPILYRAYYQHSMRNAFRAQGIECRPNDVDMLYLFEIDGTPLPKEVYSVRIESPEYERWVSSRSSSPLFGKVSQGELSLARGIMERLMPQLTAGTHKMTMRMSGRCLKARGQPDLVTLEAPLASGDFTLEIGAKDLDKLTAQNGEKLPQAGRTDAKLAKEMAAIVSSQWKDDQVLKAIIVDKDWTVTRAPLTGIPLRRGIKSAIVVKQQSGKCVIFDVMFEQKANGSRGFGETLFGGVGNNTQIPCANVK
jgi:hypothetical protein